MTKKNKPKKKASGAAKSPKKMKNFVDAHKDSAKLAEEYLSGWKRAQADLANAEKRFEEQTAERARYANKALVLDLLPVLDNYDRAFDGMDSEQRESGWAKGFEFIKKQIEDVLAANGVVRYESAGQKFDTDLHEAVDHVAGEKDTVIEEVAAGYKMHDKVIRHAKVKVGNGEKA